MEDIITKIINIEQEAQSISDEAASKLNTLNEDIAREIDSIAEKYKSQADAKLLQIKQQEDLEEEAIIESKRKQFENEYIEHQRKWQQNAKKIEDAIYQRIITR